MPVQADSGLVGPAWAGWFLTGEVQAAGLGWAGLR